MTLTVSGDRYSVDPRAPVYRQQRSWLADRRQTRTRPSNPRTLHGLVSVRQVGDLRITECLASSQRRDRSGGQPGRATAAGRGSVGDRGLVPRLRRLPKVGRAYSSQLTMEPV